MKILANEAMAVEGAAAAPKWVSLQGLQDMVAHLV